MLLKSLEMQIPVLQIPFIQNIHLQVRGENQGHNLQMDYMQLNWHFSGGVYHDCQAPKGACPSLGLFYLYTNRGGVASE